MGKISQQIINDIQEGTICKAVSGDYVIYKRSWLMDHIDQESSSVEVCKGLQREL